MLWVLRQIGHILILPTMMGIAEIVDFCDFLSPTPEEQAAPMQLCILFLMLSSTYGLPAGQKFLGRSGQGFIHQQVILIDSRVRYKKSTDWFVCSFQGIISKGNCKKDVTAKARMPIIKFVKKKSGVAFDIRSRIKEIGSGLGKNESCRLVAPSRFTTSEVYPLVRVGRAGDIITLSSHYL
ncbi:hypothetical protein V6Z11_A06G074900 [Gossypium hirsutum]|uniref:Uncharacterized protein isoform X2 n=1 Tax=Gossypium hirsutum TaxID=3635 RepID=A0ABM3BVP7_GOSHI|nr:uncharacterized protein LOC107962676 isoform X2 [Gossypium hirsutum]